MSQEAISQEAAEQTARRYIRFAETEVRGRSPSYESLSRGVAADPAMIAFLLTLPSEKRQPNLFLGAVRQRLGLQPDWSAFRNAVLSNQEAVRAVMLARSTQTNEPHRCAVLLPLLARLPQPLALIEVGASAGLCLLPDAYRYDYSGQVVGGSAGPLFPCRANGATPVPEAVPRIVWRAGLDLNPIDPADPEEVAWLECLVWPEQTSRLERLRQALAIATERKPPVQRGDLLGNDLANLCAGAPRDATLVIFHTAVLAYVATAVARDAFAATTGRLCDYWIANETPSAFPAIAAQAGATGSTGQFLLSMNGTPVAWTDPHGAAIDWIAPIVPP